MFERSALAGIAGNYQWGLDAGDHQEGWNPLPAPQNIGIMMTKTAAVRMSIRCVNKINSFTTANALPIARTRLYYNS